VSYIVIVLQIKKKFYMRLENFKKFIKYYGRGHIAGLLGFGVISFVAGLLEFAGVALIYPCVVMIIAPDTPLPYLNRFAALAHPAVIALVVFLIFLLKNFFMIFVQFVQNKFVTKWKKDIAKKYMEYYIYAPYSEVMKTSPSDKLYLLNTLCPQAVDGFVMRLLTLVTNLTISAMIVALLFIKFPLAALFTLVFAIGSLVVQNRYFKERTAAIATEMAKAFARYNSVLLENITNLKELKILNAENFFYENYLDVENSSKDILARSNYYASIPPFITEIIVVFSLFVLAGVISIQNFNSSDLVASFALVAMAIFRITPALNRIQTSIININASRDFVRLINEQYEKCGLANFKPYRAFSGKHMKFQREIELKNINFEYASGIPVIKNLSFTIERGDFIGIIGLSGAGKSTLADILTGLLPPQSGEILVDGVKLNAKNYPEFRSIIGYVPQQINVLDKSFRENTAWGAEEIDDEGVVKALKAAQLYDFVCEFPQGIEASPFTGATGLSQGQKQRLAIARALYRDPEILIFDEATSSLDVQAEDEITRMLDVFGKSKTIIAIAHRLSTLKACNKLVYLKDGRIVDIGTFAELSARYPDFENLVKLSSI